MCSHGKLHSAIAIHASSLFEINTAFSSLTSCGRAAHRFNFFRSFPTKIRLKMGALGKCIGSVGCIFAGRKTGDMNNFKAVKDVFPGM